MLTRVHPRLNTMTHVEKVEFCKCFIYVRCSINNKAVIASVDFGATNNYIEIDNARRLGLSLSPTNSMLKAMNFEATNSHGIRCYFLGGQMDGKCGFPSH